MVIAAEHVYSQREERRDEAISGSGPAPDAVHSVHAAENGRMYLRQWALRELKLFAAQLKKEDDVSAESTRCYSADAVEKHVAGEDREPKPAQNHQPIG